MILFNKSLAFSFLFFSLFILPMSNIAAAEVVSVSPEGSVKSIQQVLVRFSTDMTALGDPRDTLFPFKAICKDNNGKNIQTPATQSRWADSKNWSFDFATPLESGVRCEFVMKEELRDLKGEKVTNKDFSFSTSGPSILSSKPSYESIEPDQYFILKLDGVVNEDSVVKHTYFEVEGYAEKTSVKIIRGADRTEILKSQYENDLYKNEKIIESEDQKFLVIGATKRFPENGKVVFHWTTGVQSKTGINVTDAQTKEYAVLAPFTATFSCERVDFNEPCSPVSDMRVEFSRQVRLKEVKDTTLVSLKNTWKPAELNESDAKDPDKMVYSLTFKGPFPEKRKFQVNLSQKIKDDSGRPLANNKEFPLQVGTDAYSPLIKFSARFGVVEWTTESMLPVSVRNIEKKMQLHQLGFEGKSFNLSSLENARDIIALYDLTQQKSEYAYDGVDPRNDSIFKKGYLKNVNSFTLPKASQEQDFEMMGIPLKNPGFYVVEVESPRLGGVLTLNKKPMYVATAVLVTNMGIHFKKGLESNLVWVTELKTAKPVEGAAISIRDCRGEEIAKGVTNKSGIIKFGKLASTKKSACTDWEDHFFVFAKKGIDLSFMSTGWSQGIESWRYQVEIDSEYSRKVWGGLVAHTVLDRTLFKPGETVQMKHVLRERAQNGFRMAEKKVWPKSLSIRHSGSGKVYEFPIKIDPVTGTALNSFSITKEMELGNYDIFLSDRAFDPKKQKANTNEDNYDDEESEYDYRAKKTGSFIVSDFRLPLMAATVKILGETLIRVNKVKADLSAHYLSGGPAVKLAVETRAQLSPSLFTPDFPGSDEYTFFQEPLKAGFVPKEGGAKNTDGAVVEDIRQKNLVLDDKGGSLLEVNDIDFSFFPKKLIVEMDYADPNGEIKTASGEKTIYPSKNIVGLRVDNWFGTSQNTKILGVVTNPDSVLQKNIQYEVEAFKRERFSHRKRLVGGFYSYDSREEVKSLGVVCKGSTDETGRFECFPKNLPSGSIELQAKVNDDQGSATYSRIGLSIYNEGEDSWWSSNDSDRIDLLPAKKEYAPNEVAEFIVKTPFKEATALVTVEREGILDQFVTTISRDQPVIKVPLKGHFAPNVFVSAVVVRGRISEPKADFLVDLGKPAMKMGVSEIKVGWSAHRLNVTVETNKKKYNVREEAVVKIKLESPDGKPLEKNTEVVLIALDEALLLLRSNVSFDLLAAMMTKRGLGVEASSNVNQVIGRRHFGLKAKPPGGGGGLLEGPREKFNPLLAFIPNLKVNEKGEVETKIKLNDSISNFRIVAVAHSGAQYFGTGKVNIVTNKDLIMYSGVSPVARMGDQIDSVFTLRNASDKKMKITFQAEVLSGKTAIKQPAFPVIELNPSQSQTVTLPIQVPDTEKELSFLVTAKDSEGGVSDSVKVKATISPSVPARILQATLFQLDKTETVNVMQPKDAILGSGAISVSARSTLASGLSGVRRYMEDYPYNCLEQRTSKAIVLNDKKALAQIITDLPSFMDDGGLLKFFDWPQLCGSPSLTRYILDILDENQEKIPTQVLSSILDGLNNSLHGRESCRSWWIDVTKNEFTDQEKVLTMQTLSRYKKFQPSVIESINITPNLWSTETLNHWILLLSREKTIQGRDEKLKTAMGILKARLNFQGSMMTLQGSQTKNYDESYWRLFTSKDQEAIGVLNVSLAAQNAGEIADAGRMARALITRMKRGHWDTTSANAWGVTVMKKFSQAFEKEQVKGLTKLEASESKTDIDWKKNPQGTKKLMAWPKSSFGTGTPLIVSHQGTGKPWVHLETSSAIPLKDPMNFGYTIKKTIRPISQKNKNKWTVGDVMQVDLILTAATDQSWVVLRDPLPSGASHLGTGLEGESTMLDNSQDKKSSANLKDLQDLPIEFEEKSFSNLTRYSGFLRAGTYKTSYKIRLNSSGTFKLPPSRAEAMYAPEVFGELPNANVQVLP